MKVQDAFDAIIDLLPDGWEETPSGRGRDAETIASYPNLLTVRFERRGAMVGGVWSPNASCCVVVEPVGRFRLNRKRSKTYVRSRYFEGATLKPETVARLVKEYLAKLRALSVQIARDAMTRTRAEAELRKRRSRVQKFLGSKKLNPIEATLSYGPGVFLADGSNVRLLVDTSCPDGLTFILKGLTFEQLEKLL